MQNFIKSLTKNNSSLNNSTSVRQNSKGVVPHSFLLSFLHSFFRWTRCQSRRSMLLIFQSEGKNTYIFAYTCTKYISGRIQKKTLTMAPTKTGWEENRGDFHFIPHRTFYNLNCVVFIQNINNLTNADDSLPLSFSPH